MQPETIINDRLVDERVGQNVRARRKALGISQQALAAGLGLTFQQVQKYERGGNRISASKLFGIAGLLRCPVAELFAGLDQEAGAGTTWTDHCRAVETCQPGMIQRLAELDAYQLQAVSNIVGAMGQPMLRVAA